MRSWYALALLTAVVMGTAGGWWAEAAPWPVPTSGTTWYRISLLGRPSGYMSSSARLVRGEQGEELLETADRQVITIALGGETLRVTEDVVTRYTATLAPVRWDVRLDKMGQLQEVTAERKGDNLHIVSVEGGQRTEQTVALPEGFASELAVLAEVIRGTLKPGETRTVSTFLPQVGAVDTEEITAGEPETLQVLGEGQRCFPLRVVTKRVGSEIRLWVNEQGEVVKYALPTLMNALVEKVSQQEALAQLSPLVLTNSIPLDRKLAGMALQRLTLDAKGVGQTAADLIPVTARQEVTPGPEGTARVVIHAQNEPAHTAALPVKAEGREEYLRATPMAQSEAPEVRDLARQIVGEKTDAWEAALALNNWVYQNLGKMASEPRPINCLQILAQRKGDCSEHALLMATLARAVGLPSRLVAGLAVIEDKLYYHAWVEVYVGEWVEMDPTWGEARVDAGHLLLARSAMDDLSFARMSLETGRTLGTLAVSVVEAVGG